jgi:hypothetical protein
LDSVEGLEKKNGLARVVAGARAVINAQLIGFQFVVAAVAKEKQLGGHAAEIEKILRGKPEDSLADERTAEKEALTHLLLPGLPRRMASSHMADLVRQNSRELVLVIQIGKHPAGDIDVASGKRHSIDNRAVENSESYRCIAKFFRGPRPPEMAAGEDSVADLRNIALKFRISVNTEKRRDFLAALLADCAFFLPAIAEKLFLPGGGNGLHGAADPE